jgi:hypothetical protein
MNRSKSLVSLKWTRKHPLRSLRAPGVRSRRVHRVQAVGSALGDDAVAEVEDEAAEVASRPSLRLSRPRVFQLFQRKNRKRPSQKRL